MKVRITRTTYEHCDIDIDPPFAKDGTATPKEVVEWLERNLAIARLVHPADVLHGGRAGG